MSLHANPFAALQGWYDEAVASGLLAPNAMTLATVSPDGKPSARIVLLKEIDGRGLVFYTNYESRKARELAANPAAALVFYWAPLDRQVRVEGRVEKTSREESQAYFATRPRGSQLGAWASMQSAVLPGREPLEARLAELERSYPEGTPVPCPPYWGGYRLLPDSFEFWIGRPNRLHDRHLYTRRGGAWNVARLAP